MTSIVIRYSRDKLDVSTISYISDDQNVRVCEYDSETGISFEMPVEYDVDYVRRHEAPTVLVSVPMVSALDYPMVVKGHPVTLRDRLHQLAGEELTRRGLYPAEWDFKIEYDAGNLVCYGIFKGERDVVW